MFFLQRFGPLQVREEEIAEISKPAVLRLYFIFIAILGQHPFSADEAEKILNIVGIGHNDEYISLLQEIPSRAHPNVQNPNDPTVKRLQEVVDVYGPSIKAITHELCGDGIISAIDCKIDVNKKEDPNGDRVVITIDGKFLKYTPW